MFNALFGALWKRVALFTVATLVAAGAIVTTVAHKSVALVLDGSPVAVGTFSSTVGDVLAAEGVKVGEHDEVSPALDAGIQDGDRIEVNYGRLLSLTIDGKRTEHWTTARTLDTALAALGLRTEGAKLSTSRSQPLGRQGLSVTVVTPKQVTLVADGKTQRFTSTAQTVRDLLAERNVRLDKDDKLSPRDTTAVTSGLKVVVQRVDVKKSTETVAVAHSTTTKKDSSKYTDYRKVTTPGKDGSKKVVTAKTYVDGKLTSTKVVSETVVTKPVTEVVVVGTKSRPVATAPAPSAGNVSGAGINLANAAMWDRIAQCESGGNWHINTGNGYYGGLQFATASWLANGGADFASRADLASREQQITVANRYYAKAGLSPWGCAWAA